MRSNDWQPMELANLRALDGDWSQGQWRHPPAANSPSRPPWLGRNARWLVPALVTAVLALGLCVVVR